MSFLQKSRSGFTLIELVLAVAIAAMLMVALTGLAGRISDVRHDTQLRNNSIREARFAMHRMVTAVRQTDRLLLPLADNPSTNWRENVREQTNPPRPPEGDSVLATAVLAVTMGRTLDRDENGWADANNDEDFIDFNDNGSRDPGEPERVDEDLPDDNSRDGRGGLIGIDDDGDGLVDEAGPWGDDDEDGVANEDNAGSGDEDKDGSTDEDRASDNNGDGKAGESGIDDDHDGMVDEANNRDDDEDGFIDEDWLDPIVFHLDGTTLLERLPILNAAHGTHYEEYPIADNVTHFRIERISAVGQGKELVDITLVLTHPGGEPVSLTTRVRVGGAR